MPSPGAKLAGAKLDSPGSKPASPAALPAELEARISLLESGRESGADFDRTSLCWLLVLGLLIPLGLLLLGWRV